MAFSERLPPFGPLLSYLFSNPLNRLDFDPSCPKSLKTFGNYIRKWRTEKGVLIRKFAKELGVTEDTVINWEKRGVSPCKRHIWNLQKFLCASARNDGKDETTSSRQ
jgi:DNA-binding XRE family transcriptional regulator